MGIKFLRPQLPTAGRSDSANNDSDNNIMRKASIIQKHISMFIDSTLASLRSGLSANLDKS